MLSQIRYVKDAVYLKRIFTKLRFAFVRSFMCAIPFELEVSIIEPRLFSNVTDDLVATV